MMNFKANHSFDSVCCCNLLKKYLIVVVPIGILLSPLCFYYFITTAKEPINTNKQLYRPLCMDEILTRKQLNKQALLMDGEDPDQIHADCRLHHYQEQDVAACLDELSSRLSRHQRPVQIAFIGESTARNQFTSLLRV
jgi:hypothetical protein